MGLDMYGFTMPKDSDINNEDQERTEIAYWRKFNALHGWMEDLYQERGGTEEFNCVPVKLEHEDLNRLEDDIINNKLEPRVGFFFGNQTIEDYDIETTLKFISQARKAMLDGCDVYYDSWW